MTDTIFMIHGMWGGPWNWEKFRPVFEAAGYRCVTAALPYHDLDPRGMPDPRLGTASMSDYADMLEREIRQLGEKPIVMGHSMGGLLAQILGARGLAKELVLLTPASPAGIVPMTPSVMRTFWRIMTKWGWWRKPTRLAFADAAYSALHLLPENERKPTYDRLVFESGRATFEIALWPFDRSGATRVDAAKITCPVLVVGGTLDRITPASVVRRVAKRYKAVSTYKEFPNHGHWVLAEPQWEEVAEYVLDWLKSRPSAKSALVPRDAHFEYSGNDASEASCLRGEFKR